MTERKREWRFDETNDGGELEQSKESDQSYAFSCLSLWHDPLYLLGQQSAGPITKLYIVKIVNILSSICCKILSRYYFHKFPLSKFGGVSYYISKISFT